MQNNTDKIMELLEITEVKDDGKVIFTKRSKKILEDLASEYKETSLFKKSKQNNPNWCENLNSEMTYVYMCEKILDAPTDIHMIATCKLMIPIIWEKLQAELNPTTPYECWKER